MRIKFGGRRANYKIAVMAILLALACFLIYYFHVVVERGTIFTHSFYIPIILASLWWGRKGLIVAIFLAVLLIFSHIFLRQGVMTTANDFLRALMFVVVAFVVVVLGERIMKARAQVELAHTELEQIFNTASSGMHLIDKDFNMLRVNEAFSTLSGISRDEAVGKKCYEVFPGPLCHTPDCALTRILGGEERVDSEVEKERKDGTRSTYILVATPFRGYDGELVGIVEDFRDITERKQAEQALRESEGKYKALVEEAPVGVMNVDIKGKITYVNKTILQSTGYLREELVGKNAFGLGLVARETIGVLVRRMKEKLAGKPPSPLEIQFKCKDGKWIWL